MLDTAQGNFLIAEALIDEIRAGNLHVEELLHVNRARVTLFYRQACKYTMNGPSPDCSSPMAISRPQGLCLRLQWPPSNRLICRSQPTASRRERTVLGSALERLASFLPLRPDKRFAFFHKSVRDWLHAAPVDTSGVPIARRFAIDVRVGRTALADWAHQAFQLGGLKTPDLVTAGTGFRRI